VRPLGLLTEDVIEQAFARLGDLAGSTWNKYLDAIRLMQRWGVKKGYLPRPWLSADNEQVVRKPTAKRNRRLVPDVLDDQGKVTTPGEERRLLACADPWLQRLILAALESGCREGELLSLLWGDVSLSRCLIRVRAENAKSGQMREIPISTGLRGVLAMIDKDPKGNDHKVTAHVFGDSVGGPLTFPKKRWQTCRKAAGITSLRFHDLRHEAGSRLLEAGWPLQQVQAVLGHADAKTTSNYLNATQHHLLDSMKRLGTRPLHSLAHETDPAPPPSVQQESDDSSKVVVN
jgi:integrase